MYSAYFSTSKKQLGVCLPGLLTWSIIIVLATIIEMKLIPSYIEFSAVKRALVATASDPRLQNAAEKEFRLAFDKRAAIDGIKSVSGKDIVINKQNEQVILGINYSVVKPLFANLSLQIDFDAANN